MRYTTFNLRCLFSTLVFFTILSCSESNTTNSSNANAQPKTETASTTPVACALLLEEDATALLGNKVTKGMSTASMCQYLSAAEELSKAGEHVTLTLQTGAASEYEKYIASTEETLKIKAEPVTGIGDKAAWAGGSLVVTHKNEMLIVMLGKNMEKPEHLAKTKELAQKILARLKKESLF